MTSSTGEADKLRDVDFSRVNTASGEVSPAPGDRGRCLETASQGHGLYARVAVGVDPWAHLKLQVDGVEMLHFLRRGDVLIGIGHTLGR